MDPKTPKSGSDSTHDYQVRNTICKKGDKGCSLRNVYEAVRRYPAPGADRENPVTTGSETNVYGLGPVRHEVDESHLTVTDITTPEHRLHPGRVTHQIRETGEAIEVVTTGTGTGPYGTANTIFAPPLWWAVMEGVKNDVKSKEDTT